MRKALLLSLVLSLVPALPVEAATVGKKPAAIQSQPLPPPQYPVPTQLPPPYYQAQPTMPDGNPNIYHYWYEYGGARLYWRGPEEVQQIKLFSPNWRDPALVPPLTGLGSGKSGRRGGRARAKAKPDAAKAGNEANATPAAKAPDGAGKTALQAPKSARTGGQLGPGPKPTTYTEITPKLAQSLPGKSVSAPAPMSAPVTAPMTAPVPAASPAPLTPAAPLPATPQTSTGGAIPMSAVTAPAPALAPLPVPAAASTQAATQAGSSAGTTISKQ